VRTPSSGAAFRRSSRAAFAFKFRNEPRVAVAFFGDGATNTGTFHESLNLAQLWRVPAVFVCEHNKWAESTPSWQHMPIETSPSAPPRTHEGDEGRRPGREAVYDTAKKALAHARSTRARFHGGGRRALDGHYVGDPQVSGRKASSRSCGEARPNHALREKIDIDDDRYEAMTRGAGDRRGVGRVLEAGTDPQPKTPEERLC